MTWNWELLRAGEFMLDGGGMFGIIPKPVWTRWVTPDDKNRVALQQNCLLLERDGKLVVIETGIGDKFGEKERTIYGLEDRAVHDALHDVDCDPADIDAVILTHLHFDHAGGLTRRGDNDKPVLTFPNAEIIVQKQEWEDAIANRSTMHKTYLADHLNEDVAEHVTLVDGEAEVFSGVTVWPVPGHTWGQQAVRFDGGDNGTVVFVPDVMPSAAHSGAAYSLAYDVEPYTSMITKRWLLEDAVEFGWTLCLDHEPGNPFCTVERDGKGWYRLIPSE